MQQVIENSLHINTANMHTKLTGSLCFLSAVYCCDFLTFRVKLFCIYLEPSYNQNKESGSVFTIMNLISPLSIISNIVLMFCYIFFSPTIRSLDLGKKGKFKLINLGYQSLNIHITVFNFDLFIKKK